MDNVWFKRKYAAAIAIRISLDNILSEIMHCSCARTRENLANEQARLITTRCKWQSRAGPPGRTLRHSA